MSTSRFSVRLEPHPDCAASGFTVRVAGAWDGACLELVYALEGDLDALLILSPETPVEPDRLWAHSCFEVFMAESAGVCMYREYNFSSSGQWAGYAFSGYRKRIGCEIPAPENPCWRRESRALSLAVRLPVRSDNRILRLALSAVLELADGRLHYFALCHPPGAPDFHHPCNFTLSLTCHDNAFWP
jgi:hypothetical protein